VRVLLIGSGGREHALATALVADPDLTTLICAPGNPGMASLSATTLAPLDVSDGAAIAALAVESAADLVVIGPEAPLVAGAADLVRAKGIACFGPTGAAAMLEGSKAFAKDVMRAANVPTARSVLCTDADALASALDEFSPPYVVKDDGLAAGKGVLVTEDRAAAFAHGLACGRVVVEEFLDGPEVSLFVVTDGTAAVPLLPAQDFKRIGDGDTGPNTGGMGAYAPLPWAPPNLVEDVMATVVEPTLAEMRERGTPFAGLLYVGLVLTPTPKVIEFNCRFGDPETEVVLPLLETPLAGLLAAAATGRLAGHAPLRWRDAAAVTVVIASAGYPATSTHGDVIEGADGVPGMLHAGTARRRSDGALIAAGGRVLACTATGPTLEDARRAAYRLVDGVTLAGSQHRRDIALAAAREAPNGFGATNDEGAAAEK
jgi:phosphoribosylamine--glycine ligase